MNELTKALRYTNKCKIAAQEYWIRFDGYTFHLMLDKNCMLVTQSEQEIIEYLEFN